MANHHFIDASNGIQRALNDHYAGGDYARLGMKLQDFEDEVLAALGLAAMFEQAQLLMGKVRDAD